LDDHVLRGMARWPNVPAVYGWLALDRRGQWLIKGERITSPVVIDYIGRNYERDAEGRWFFQNGPQRVFVSLEYAPLVFRVTSAVSAPLELCTHTRIRPAALKGAYIDENGAIVVDSDVGPGIVDDRDLDAFASALIDANGEQPGEDALDAIIEHLQRGADAALWLEYGGSRVKLGSLQSTEAPRRFGFEPQPAAPAGHPECD
jgi:hypothetical protein